MPSPFLSPDEKKIFDLLLQAQTRLSLNPSDLTGVPGLIADAKNLFVDYIVEQRARAAGL
jgi:hypothetical protein